MKLVLYCLFVLLGVLAPVKKDGKWGYIDKKGDVVVPFKFDFADTFSDGIATVAKKDKFSFIDTSGHYLPLVYDFS